MFLSLLFSCLVMSDSLRYKTWSTGEGNGKPLQYFCLVNPMNSTKRQKDYIGQVILSLDFTLNETRSH